MVYEPGLEPKPGLGLWQALNSGLAQEFQSPSPPKPGPIHHYSHMMQCTMGINPSQLGGSPMNGQMPSRMLISIQTQMVKMQPMSQPQLRILLNGGMHPLTTPSISVTSQSSQTSPSQAAPWPTGQSPNDEMKQISCPICREIIKSEFLKNDEDMVI